MKTTALQDVIRDFTFSDDCADSSNRSVPLTWNNMDRFSNDCDNFGLVINSNKP